jgi:hypothetical protein
MDVILDAPCACWKLNSKVPKSMDHTLTSLDSSVDTTQLNSLSKRKAARRRSV